MKGVIWCGVLLVGVFAAGSFAVGSLGRPSLRSSAPSAALGDFEQCADYAGRPPGFPDHPLAGMRRIAGGIAKLGSERGYADERPVRNQQLAPFWIDTTEVTNAQFAAFVAATGYVTDAERMGAGVVFVPPKPGEEAPPSSWWRLQSGASWRHPEGPESTLVARAHDPVVQVTRADALAYAKWLGHDLPSEAQWEHAAKGGGDNDSADAAVFDAAHVPQANFWQGDFPFANTASDHYAGRAPVGCYAANTYGLHDMIGNVWEWTRDDYAGAYQPHGSGHAERARPSATSHEVAVIKGGSYLCAANFCVRYRASARHPQEVDLPASHVGFRTVRRGGGSD